jgi:hypothetical protein
VIVLNVDIRIWGSRDCVAKLTYPGENPYKYKLYTEIDKKNVILKIVHRKASQNMCKCKLCKEMDHKICASINCAQKWITKRVHLRSTGDHSIAKECTNNGKGF